MNLTEARMQALAFLRERGRAKNSELLEIVGNDTMLLDAVREDLIFEDLAQDKNGVGLLYIGEGAAAEPASAPRPAPAPVPAEKLRIFLSYGHDEHAALAEKLRTDLIARGHEVWFDAERLKPGGDWEHYIDEGLHWAAEAGPRGRVLLLMTPHSVRRPDGYCLNEIARAVDRRIFIVPVMVVEVEPPLSICRIQWLDMRDCLPLQQRGDRYSGRLDTLVVALETLDLDFEGGQSRLYRLLNPLPFDADLAQHLPRFTGRQWLFDRVDAWLADPAASRIFWITGGPGVGKTALACKLCTRREIAAFHLCRFGHDQKADPRQVVRSIAWQLCTQLPEYAARLTLLRDLEEVCRDGNVQTLFDRLVVQPLHGGFPRPDRTIVVLIDGLDEATRDGRNELSEFLGHHFANLPDWVRMIITSRPEEEVMQPLQGLEPFVFTADSEENRTDMRAFLQRELAECTENSNVLEKAIDAIISNSEGVFLYAEWVRREIAAGRFQLDRLDSFPHGLGGVYDAYFRRRFADFKEYRERFRPLMELVAASYEPLAIAYAAEVLGWSGYDTDEVPAAFGSLLSISDGLMKPFHRTMVDWLTDKARSGAYRASADEGHRRFADKGWCEYEDGIESMTPYMKAHLPRHLIAAGHREKLERLLGDLAYFDFLWTRNESETMELYARMKKETAESVVDIFGNLLAEPEGDLWAIRHLVILIQLHGFTKESEPVLEWLIDTARKDCNKKLLQSSLRGKGWLLDNFGENKKAMTVYEECEAICREIGDRDGLQLVIGNKASILNVWGRNKEAMELYKEQEKICRELGNKDGLQMALGSIAGILKTWGRMEEAMELYKEKEMICREMGNKNDLESALGSIAGILRTWGRMEEAITLLKEQEIICREMGNKNSLQIALDEQAKIHHDKGNYNDALQLYRKAEKICRSLGNQYGLEHILCNQAGVYIDQGNHEMALPLLLEEEKILEEIHHIAERCACYINLGLVYEARGDSVTALEYYQKSLDNARDINSPFRIAESLGFQAGVYREMDEYDKARELYTEQERICRELGEKFRLCQCLANQSLLYSSDLYDHALALEKATESLAIAEESGFDDLVERIRPIKEQLALFGPRMFGR